MIKELKREETPFCKKEDKLGIFTEDIRKIIRDRIEYCELVDFPYASVTAVSDLRQKARKICRITFWEEAGCSPSATEFFDFSKRVESDGKMHFYAYFAVTAWEKELKLYKE